MAILSQTRSCAGCIQDLIKVCAEILASTNSTPARYRRLADLLRHVNRQGSTYEHWGRYGRETCRIQAPLYDAMTEHQWHDSASKPSWKLERLSP